MATTGLQINWTGVEMGSTQIKKVTSVRFQDKGQTVKFHGDDSPWPQAVAISTFDSSATLKSGDEATILSIAIGATGTFTATHVDALHATNGNIVYTLANAIVTDRDTGGDYGKFGDATLKIEAYSSDGSTPPLSYSRS